MLAKGYNRQDSIIAVRAYSVRLCMLAKICHRQDCKLAVHA
jgi:hypothetical protein